MDGWRDGKKLLLKWNKHDLSQNNMWIYIYIYIEKDRYEGVCIYTYQTCTQQLTVDLIYIYMYINLWCYTQRCTSSERCQWEQLHVSPTAQHPIPGVGDAGHPESWEGSWFFLRSNLLILWRKLTWPWKLFENVPSIGKWWCSNLPLWAPSHSQHLFVGPMKPCKIGEPGYHKWHWLPPCLVSWSNETPFPCRAKGFRSC